MPFASRLVTSTALALLTAALLSAQAKHRATEPLVTMALRDVDADQAVRKIAQAARVSYIAGPALKGEITAAIDNLPVVEAFDAAVASLGLMAVRDRHDVFRFVPRGPAAEEKLTFGFKEHDVREAAMAIADRAKVSVALSPAITGKVTLELDTAHWRVAMRALAEQVGAAFVDIDGVVRLVPLRGDAGHRVHIAMLALDAKNVCRMLAKISGHDVVVDVRVDGRVSMKLAGVDTRVAIGLIADELGAEVVEKGGVLRVQPRTPRPDAAKRVTVAFHESEPAEVAVLLARAAGQNIEVDPALEVRVTARLHDARWDVALDAIADLIGARVETTRGGGLRLAKRTAGGSSAV